MAKTDIWMPLYINDYLSDTLHLSAEESGAYLFLIMHYWKKGNISGDIEQISRISRCATSITQAILSEFFEYANGSWKHGRIDIELKKAQDNKEMRAIRAKKAADARWSKDATSKPQAMLNECPSPSPSSSPTKTPLPTPTPTPTQKDVLGEVWKYWNGKENLPNDPYMPTSMSDPRRLLDVVNGHTLERVKECIDKLDRLYPSLDKKPGSPGGLLSNNSITYWLNAKEETKETMSQEEMEKFAEEVFG